jgi:biotin carboxylase
VTDAHSRAAVAGIRGLGRAGVSVVAQATSRGAAGRWSRYAAAGGADLAALVAEHGPLVVYPGQENAVATLAAGLPPGALPSQPGDAALALGDKVRAAELGVAAGVPPPALRASGTAEEIAGDPPPAPVAVKSPGLSDALPGTLVCDTDAEVRALLDSLPADEPVLVQERAAGALVGVSLVLDRDGAVVARFQQVARRLWPTAAGASSAGVSVAPDDDLVERAAAVLRGADYWGLAQLQFVATARGPALIDVNPRFYGSLPLALAAGANLPAAWHAVATGERPSASGDYRIGVGYRWLEGELTAAFNGELRRLIEAPPRPRVGAMWAADDPLPGMVLGADAARQRISRRRPSRGDDR